MSKHVKTIGENTRRTEEMMRQNDHKKGYASGGRVDSYPDMTKGSLSGEGRLEKIKTYGDKAKP